VDEDRASLGRIDQTRGVHVEGCRLHTLVGQRLHDAAPDALGCAGDDGAAAGEFELHADSNASSRSQDFARRPSSTSWSSSTSFSNNGVGSPASRRLCRPPA
jgi:hypothetical protein